VESLLLNENHLQITDVGTGRPGADQIAKAIEEQMDYPGEIKVTVVRETRAVEFAR